jgi:hypothetical protein
MRKILTLPFGLVFLLLVLTTIFVFSLKSFALDSKFYTSILNGQGVFQVIQSDPLSYFDLGSQFGALNQVPADTQRKIVNAALPSGWLEQQVGSAIRSVLDWLNSTQPQLPSITLDLRPIKDRLQGPPGEAIARDITAAIPTCSANQQPALSLDRLPDCLPENLDRTLVSDQVAAFLKGAANDVPNTIDAGMTIADRTTWDNLAKVRRVLQFLDVGVLALALIAIFVWLMGALIGGENPQARLHWAGGWLLFSSMMVIGICILVFVLRSSLVAPFGMGSTVPAIIVDAFHSVGSAMLEQFAIRAIIPAVVLFLLSLILIGAGRVSPAHR